MKKVKFFHFFTIIKIDDNRIKFDDIIIIFDDPKFHMSNLGSSLCASAPPREKYQVMPIKENQDQDLSQRHSLMSN